MDGNRRYAKKNNLTLKEGYQKGMDKFIEFVKLQIKHKIPEMTFWALSTDNYKKRPEEEKKTVFDIMKGFYKSKEIENLFLENKVRVEIKGNVDEVEKKEGDFISQLKKKLEEWKQKIKQHKYKINIAINYDGQSEILFAIKNIINKIKKGELDESQINTQTIKNNLWFSETSPPEIIVRPGNAPRLSGFMLWDSQYSEVYFTEKFWPELDEKELIKILDWFKNIKRNFGK